jgi:hypothetical protein
MHLPISPVRVQGILIEAEALVMRNMSPITDRRCFAPDEAFPEI